MDYTKIRLANERNSHVTKRLNRLSTWKFFKVIYRENIWRMFGFNFLMLILIAPIFVVSLLGSISLSGIQSTLPLHNGIGFSTGAWFAGTGPMGDVTSYLAMRTRQNNLFYGGMMAVAGLLLSLVFSAGFAVIRDTFWTGKMSAVGVFRSMWKGIKANFLYAFVSAAILSGTVFGIYELFVYINEIAGILWLAIVVTVLLSIVGLLLALYLLILCSVTVTYKQSVRDNLDDAWRLLWLNILPNIVHLLMALLPIALYVLLRGNIFGQLLLILILMFGGLYFPLVWQTHMMKTFALFHPVEVRKKKQKAERPQEAEELPEPEPQPQPTPAATERKPKTKKVTVKKRATQTPSDASPDEQTSEQGEQTSNAPESNADDEATTPENNEDVYANGYENEIDVEASDSASDSAQTDDSQKD